MRLRDRRSFLRSAALTMAAAPFGGLGAMLNPFAPSGITALGRASGWLNSPKLGAADLAGRAVVVNFCTYTCINWLRTLPYVKAWTRKYPSLVMIGVHTPEFPFERDVDNVRRAIRDLKIEYPVVIDNDYAIWRAFANAYWPALYFVDPRGRVRDQHFGEGEYEQSERAIQRLLMETGVALGEGTVPLDASGVEAAADWGSLRSPETYVGNDRTKNFSSSVVTRNHRRLYAAPARLSLNQWALEGEWKIDKQSALLQTAGGRITYRFHARDAHLVLSPGSARAVRFRVTIDGRSPGQDHGIDVDADGEGTVTEPRLYQLIRQRSPIVDRTLTVEFRDVGVEAFSFTFG